MKPAYVSVEFWRKDRDDTVTIEGWMTNEDPECIFVSPSLDYDADVVKFAVPNDKVISITPAQSVREYAAKGFIQVGDSNKIIRHNVDGSLEEIDLSAVPSHEALTRMLFANDFK